MTEQEVEEGQRSTERPKSPDPRRGRSRGLPPADQLLAEILEHRGWELRDGQADMVDIIMEAGDGDDDTSTAIVKAPVGTGKSLAYLVAALASDRRVAVCTSTIALQDQLIGSELPRLAADLETLYGFKLTYAVLKGRGNYPCMSAVQAMIDGRTPDDAGDDMFDVLSEMQDEDLVLLRQLKERGDAALEGEDTSQLTAEHLIGKLPQGIASLVRSTRPCSERSKRWWREVDDEELIEGADAREPLGLDELLDTSTCVYRTAYIRAMASDVVVMNTSLMAAEMLKSRRFGPLSPQQLLGTGYLVIDEGHHLTRILTDALRQDIDLRDVRDSVDTLFKRIIRKNPASEKMLEQGVQVVAETATKITQILDEIPRESKRRGPIASALSTLSSDLSNMLMGAERAEAGAELDPDDRKTLERLVRRATDDILEPIAVAATCVGQFNEDGEAAFDLTPSYAEAEGDVQYPVLHLIPIDLSFFRAEIADVTTRENRYISDSGLERVFDRDSNMVICSGTITEEVGHVIGAEEDQCTFESVASPFDPKQARICIPPIVPPSHEDWWSISWKLIKRFMAAVGGRTLILTTSNLALKTFTQWSYEDVADLYPILYQGNGMSRDEILRQFKEQESSILIGTASFWEGVDVPGQALSLVVIDKIPFPMRDDPVFNARRRFIERKGGNPFYQVDVDEASNRMAQGIGRLVRSVEDFGGVLILDHRLLEKGYGTSVLSQVPGRTPITEDLDAFEEWLRWVNPDNFDSLDSDEVPEANPRQWRPLRPGRRRRRP